MSEKQKLGRIGEQLAAHFLMQKGYTIVMQNYWTRVGEIDIVADDGETRVFVEVKAKSHTDFGQPYEQVTPEKMRRFMSACKLYCAEHPLGDKFMRIDVVSIHCDKETQTAHIKHFENITG